MGVDHGCLHILVADKFLNGPDVVAILKRGTRKRQKARRLPGRAPPKKASESLLRRRLCLPVGRGIAMVTPVPCLSPAGENSIARAARRCQGPRTILLVVTGSPSSAWEGYIYKSSPKVTGCRSGGPANC